MKRDMPLHCLAHDRWYRNVGQLRKALVKDLPSLLGVAMVPSLNFLPCPPDLSYRKKYSRAPLPVLPLIHKAGLVNQPQIQRETKLNGNSSLSSHVSGNN